MEKLILICVSLIMLSTATFTDLKTGKIKNWTTLPVFLIALLYICIFSQEKILPTLLSAIVLFALGCMGVSGWGDIKCMMALVALNDWKTGLITYIIAQVLLVVFFIFRKPKETTSEIANQTKQIIRGAVEIDTSKKRHLFAPYLLIGYALVICFQLVAAII